MTSSASLNVAWQLTSWLLAISVGVALIGLEGINLDHLMAFSKFNPNFLVIPNPISYLLSELPLSLRHFLDLREACLRVFFNLSDISLNWAKKCFAGLVFLPSPCLFGNPDLMVWPPHTCCLWPCQACQKSCMVRGIISLWHFLIPTCTESCVFFFETIDLTYKIHLLRMGWRIFPLLKLPKENFS